MDLPSGWSRNRILAVSDLAPRRGGYPCLITSQPARIERLVEAIGSNGNMTNAAGTAGIPRRTVYKWIERGEAALEDAKLRAEDADAEGDLLSHVAGTERPYAEMVLRIAEARAAFQNQALAVIRASSVTSWQAAAWLLERTFPDQYALHTSRFVSEEDKGAAVRIVDDVSSE